MKTDEDWDREVWCDLLLFLKNRTNDSIYYDGYRKAASRLLRTLQATSPETKHPLAPPSSPKT